MLNSFYWAIITLSTIGYGDVVPTIPLAKYFTISVAITQVFLLGYLITVVSATVTEASQHRVLGTLGTDLSEHIIVLGYSDVGRAAVRELLAQGEKVGIVTEEATEVANVRTLATDKQIFATFGPPGRARDPEAGQHHGRAFGDCLHEGRHDQPHRRPQRSRVEPADPDRGLGLAPELKQTLQSAGVTASRLPATWAADSAPRRVSPRSRERGGRPHVDVLGADIEEFLLTATTPVSNQTLAEAEQLVRSGRAAS